MRTVLSIALGCLIVAGCGGQATPTPAVRAPQVAKTPRVASGPAAYPRKLDAEHLPNPWQLHERVISGGQPEGDAAFAELAALGVQTVISVDGARPDVAAANKYGLRYVHLPHGYDGIPEERAKELAKAVRDLPGPVYIHCHHGHHRSPAAATVACVSAGLLDPSGAVAVLQAAGTSEHYQGLYDSARQARKFEDALLDELRPQFPETADLPPLAEAMVAIEHTHDHLKQIEAAGWKSPTTHPDLVPAHEALLLREHFTELLRAEAVKQEPAEFRAILKDSEAVAQELEDALRKPAGEASAQTAAAALARVTADCKSCHTTFRDVPLSRKSHEPDA